MIREAIPEGETRQTRLRRLRMRSWRRGTREMDLILGPFADSPMSGLDDGLLDAYEALLVENDQDLYRWITAAEAGPDRLGNIIGEIRRFHEIG